MILLCTDCCYAQESFTEYHKNGKIAFQGSKVDGQLVGEYAAFYKNGNIQLVARYNSGFLIQKKEYHETGELMTTFYFINGTEFFKAFHYYKSGQLKKEGKVDRGGLESGEWFYYSEDNELSKMVVFDKGKVIG